MTFSAPSDIDDWQWLSAAELAKQFGVTDRAFRDRVAANGWDADEREYHPETNRTGLWRKRSGKGGGREYHYRLLPARKQAALVKKHAPPPEDPVTNRKALKAAISRDEAWEFYAKAPAAKKQAAKDRLTVLLAVEAAVANGQGKDDAARIIGAQNGVTRSSIFNWYARVAGVNREDWLPYLIDHRIGKRRNDDTMHEEAWRLYKSLFLASSQPTHAECYNRLKDAAKKHGWKIPSDKTFIRYVEQDIPHQVQVLEREGEEALARLYPAQRRDRSGFHALEAVNYDGHKIDVFVEWPNLKNGPSRAFLLAFQDLYSGMVVGWRIDTCENAYGFRLAFGDVIETYGIPDHVWSDNTMAAAAKENTGGSRHRHRFKIKEDDPIGLFALIGSEIHFTLPAHGQSKPIENSFATLSRYIAKSPECAGAWTGNNPLNKPADYGSAAVPLDVLIKVTEREIHRYNHDPALNSNGKGKSRAEIFAESYKDSPIRTAAGLSPEIRRHWLLAVEGVTCRKPDGSVWLFENRYWHEKLAGMIGRKVVLRFDPDHLHRPIHVYRLDGSFICTADCIEDVGFADKNAAETQGAAVKRWKRATKDLAAAENLLGMDKVAALLPTPEAAPPPEAKVVRPFFGFGGGGNLALAAAPDAETALVGDRQQETLAAFAKGVAALRLVTSNE